MEIAVNTNGKKSTETIHVEKELFAREFNEPLVHQVVNAYLAGARQGTKAQKNRSAVSGGGAKPWRQKGTGRARAGTSRGPLWRKGGVTFAAKPRDFSQKVNKKMYRNAMRSIMSELIRQDRLIAVNDNEFDVNKPKTKDLINKLKNYDAENALIVTDNVDENLFLSARNLSKINVIDAGLINPVSLVGHDKVIMTISAMKRVEEMLR